MAVVSYKRHLAKTFTWRLLGTTDTVIVSWVILGDPVAGLKIGLTEVITKLLLYYTHERFWYKIKLSKMVVFLNSRKRHITKTITWRLIGTLDTIILSWIISGNPLAALQIGFTEIMTKMVLYYIHERFWYKINYGINKRN